VVPNTIEQAMNAVRVEQLQGGIYLEPDRLNVQKLQNAVEDVFADPSMIHGIERIQKSFIQAGGVKRAADSLGAFKQRYGLI
jgi:UDP:flavonoid glycosyltransferase YjiC (YdhE family)